MFLYLFVPHSCNSHSFLPLQVDILRWYYFEQQYHFFSTQCMELAHLPPGTTGWRFCSKIQSVSWVLGSWWVWLHLAIDKKRKNKETKWLFIIQNKQTAGIIFEVNTLCMNNHFYSKVAENFCRSLYLPISLCLYLWLFVCLFVYQIKSYLKRE